MSIFLSFLILKLIVSLCTLGAGGKGRDLSLQEGASHTYILRLGYNRNSILYIYIYIYNKNKNKKTKIDSNFHNFLRILVFFHKNLPLFF